MQWPHLAKALEEISMYLLKASREHMPSYYELREKMSFNVQIDNYFYEVVFDAPAYWWYVEHGRGPTKTMRAGDPKLVDIISEWITRRRVTPQAAKDGRTPTQRQLAFLISRKIHREGYEAKPFLSRSLEEQKAYIDNAIDEAITADITEAVEEFLRKVF